MSNLQPLDPQASKGGKQSDYESIIANAILIWSKEGPSFDFDIDLETDDYEHYQAFLSVIRPDTKGMLCRVPLMMSVLHRSKEEATRGLNNTLKDMVKRGVKKEVQPDDLEGFNVGKALALINDINARKI